MTTSRKNSFYHEHYGKLIALILICLLLLLISVLFLLYQVFHRPLPIMIAKDPSGKELLLDASEVPNLLPDTIIRWASRAAITSYTFDFVNYKKQINRARPYFTDVGWSSYQNSIARLISTITRNQLFVNGVVAGPPVISNEGMVGGKYTWRVQIPFMVTYQSSDKITRKNYTIQLSIVRVSTSITPTGIGIDQFLM